MRELGRRDGEGKARTGVWREAGTGVWRETDEDGGREEDEVFCERDEVFR